MLPPSPRPGYKRRVTDKRPFEVIEGGRGDEPSRKVTKRTRKTPQRKVWECKVCLVDVKTATRSLVRMKFGALQTGELKIVGGVDGWVCLFCLSRGKITRADG